MGEQAPQRTPGIVIWSIVFFISREPVTLPPRPRRGASIDSTCRWNYYKSPENIPHRYSRFYFIFLLSAFPFSTNRMACSRSSESREWKILRLTPGARRWVFPEKGTVRFTLWSPLDVVDTWAFLRRRIKPMITKAEHPAMGHDLCKSRKHKSVSCIV